ncbi:MAG: hypothetical protein ACKKL4_02745 [Patescibacteria group bacterium]
MMTILQEVKIARVVLGIILSVAISIPGFVSASECRNDQILSYSINPGERVESFQGFYYDVSADTDPDSLGVEVNGAQQPLVYAEKEEGGYTAIVLLDRYVEGAVYVDIYAEGLSEQSCDTPISTSIVAGPFDKYDEYGVALRGSSQSSDQGSPSYTPPRTDNSQTSTNVGSDTSSDQVVQAPDNDSEGETDRDEGLADIDGLDEEADTQATTSTSSDDQIADGDTTLGDGANQSASLWGSISAMLGASDCNTFGASWPWYAWLGMIWMYLVALWLAVTYFVEPAVGQSGYRTRLTWTMGLGTALSVGFWYLANPCLTHLWVAIVLFGLGALLYWLYSEEDDISGIVIETKDES